MPLNKTGRSAALAAITTPTRARTRIMADASLVLHHGHQSAMGLVRVEHYVYDHLARHSNGDTALDFVTWDHSHRMYRAVTPSERQSLAEIILRLPPPPEPTPPERQAAPPVPGLLTRLIHMDAASRDATLAAIALRRMPILAEHAAPRRLLIKMVRATTLTIARLVLTQLHRALQRPAPTAPASPPSPFRPGDALLSIGNLWDYMDYAYLETLVRQQGVRFICCLHDVSGLEIPYVTPSPTHIYHRHWVEIGHIAERLIAVSQFSAASYRTLIATPNLFDLPIDVCGLPNFLHAHAVEIGEAPLPELQGLSFVVFCSTIEIRKNHMLLLHVWDALRQMLPPDALPVLVLAGKWGWQAEDVRNFAERNHRLRQYLQVRADVSDAELIWLYRHARFTVFPSLSEGFGLPAAESLSFGTPVVISDCPALVEATEGLMPSLHPRDFIGWRDLLHRLITDETALDALRKAAQRFMGTSYEGHAQLYIDAMK